MSKQLHVSDSLSLPLELGSQAGAIFGIRGSGKTNTAGVLAEELLKAGQPIAVVDPTDAWFGLRSSADGKRPGFPVFIFGGSHGDLPLAEADGKVIAEFIVQERVPVILSVRHLRKGGQRRFVTELCEELYHLKGRDEYRSPLTMFIDEAGTFIPARVQNLGKGEWPLTRTVGAVEDLVARGRNTGFGVVMINPRPATLHADVRSLCDTIITHRTPAPLDRKAFREWIEENASIDEQDEVLTSLATLSDGEAWVWAPALKVMKRVQVRLRESFDSSATPKPGQKLSPPRKLAEIDKEKLKGRLAAAVEQAKATDPRHLQQRVRELEAQLAKASAAKAPPAAKAEVKRVEVPVIAHADIKLIASAMSVCGKALDRVVEILDGGQIRKAHQIVAGIEAKLGRTLGRLSASAGGAVPVAPAAPPRPALTPRAAPKELPAGTPAAPLSELPPIKKGARRMAQVLCQWHPRRLEKENLAFLAGMSAGGGTFGDYLSALRRNGFLDEGGGKIGPTRAAFDYLGDDVPPRPSTPEEFLAPVRPLLKAGAARMAEYVVSRKGDEVSREELGEKAGITTSGGTFTDYLSLCRRAGVIVDVDGGGVKANPIIFEG